MFQRISFHVKEWTRRHGWALLLSLVLVAAVVRPAAAFDAVEDLSLTSLSPGELEIEWTAPGLAPTDYRVNWSRADQRFPSWRERSGNSFPSGTALTLHDLAPGVEYQVRVRARYLQGHPQGRRAGLFSAVGVQRVDDYHDDADTAGTVAVGGTASGAIDSAGDVDWFAVELTASQVYDAAVVDDDAESGLGSQLIGVYDADGALVSAGVVWSGTSGLSFAPLVSGTYHVSVAGTDEATGGYTVSVSEGSAVVASGGDSEEEDTTEDVTPAPLLQRGQRQSQGVPGAPGGLLTAVSYNTVLLFWDDPDDDSITGYRVLRGPDADNLSALVDDTGDADTSYTDSSVAAQTTYVYAIKARNARGLGPQSDPVTVTTLAATEEDEPPTSARAIADAEFTLDGQDLDTSDSNCLEDNIVDITDACTINIDTTTAIFAVDGTLDSNDRLTVKIGVDKAAVDTASAVADESDLRGTDQTVTLTFPVGRSLMRLWGDEDGSPGGSEEHFYRVNVRRIATIEAVKSSIVEGEEEVRFRITLSTQAPAGGVNVLVELTLLAPADPGPIADADFRVHTVHIPQGQTQAILEVQSSRNEIQSNRAQVNAAIQTGTGYIVGSDSEASVQVHDNDKVNVGFAVGCGQTITVGEGDGEVSFDIVLDNPVAYDFNLVITVIDGAATAGNDFVDTGLRLLDFHGRQTRVTATVQIIDDTQVEEAEEFEIHALRNGLDDNVLTPTCGKDHQHIIIEITDDDTANIVLDAPEEVTEGEPIEIGLGPRPNDTCPVLFPFTTTLTITGDTGELQGSPDTSAALSLSPCGGPGDVQVRNDDGTSSEPVWQTIDRTGQQGDRRVTFTIGPLRSSDSRVSRLILDRRSATVIIKDKPNNPASGTPVITGFAQEGFTLRADTSSIADADGLSNVSYTYQWVRRVRTDLLTDDENDILSVTETDIPSATSDNYVLTEDDLRSQIIVEVRFTDDEGNPERLTSEPTSTVTPRVEYYLGYSELDTFEGTTGTKRRRTWVYLSNWPRVRVTSLGEWRTWGSAGDYVRIAVTASYSNPILESHVDCPSHVDFIKVESSGDSYSFESRKKLEVTIRPIPADKTGPQELIGSVTCTLAARADLVGPMGPEVVARESPTAYTVNIFSSDAFAD